MIRLPALCGFALASLFAGASGTTAAADWTQRPAYPLEPGMAGLAAGAHGGALIAAGGANFPDRMPWDGGKKAYYDQIVGLKAGETVWQSVGRLPGSRAYAAVVSTREGVLVMGGENADQIFQDTLWLRWDGKTVVVTPGPSVWSWQPPIAP